MAKAVRRELPEEEVQLLVRRLRGMLWIVLLVTALFVLADRSLSPAHTRLEQGRVYALCGLQVALTFVILGVLRVSSARRAALPAALFATAETSLMAAALGVVTSDAMTAPLIAIVLLMTTASLFPWGAVFQGVAAAVVVAAILWNVLESSGSYDAVFTSRIAAVILGSVASLYTASELERLRIERKRLEHELARARDSALQSSRLKSAFLANISHEIRTPLNILLGFADLIADDLTELGITRFRPEVDGMAAASRQLLSMIHGFLDLALFESGTFIVDRRPLPLGAIVEQRVEELRPRARTKGLSLTTVIEEPDAVVVADEYCLSRALSQLLDNAVKFTESGGVEVRLWRERAGTPCLEICDTGLGMEPGYAATLFTPFSQEDAGSTRRHGGSGIGLALVHRYLQANGATISMESRKGQGSCFRIVFR